MRPLLPFFFLSAFSQAALVTTATCTVAGLVPTTSDPKSCSLFANNPSFPGTPGDPNRPGLPGYRVTADVGPGRLETHSVSGGWGNPPQGTMVSATASARFTDTVTFTGTGPATLRVTVGVRKIAVDVGGDFSYFVGGLSKGALFNNTNPFEFRSSDLDFSITRGVAIPIGFFAFTASSAANFNSATSGIDYSATQMRVYGASGEQLNITGTGEDGATYRSFFAPGDMSTGPVLTTAPEVPEPGPRTLLLIAGSIFLLLWNYGVLKDRSSSRLPQVTETL